MCSWRWAYSVWMGSDGLKVKALLTLVFHLQNDRIYNTICSCQMRKLRPSEIASSYSHIMGVVEQGVGLIRKAKKK